MLPIFRYKGDKDDTSSKLLDMEVNSKLTVPEFKAELAAKLIAEVKGFEDLPADGSRLRVRKLDYSSAVFMDDQTVQQAFNVMFTGREKLGVSVLSGPEEKTDKDQVPALCCVGRVCQSACADRCVVVLLSQSIVSVMRWRPSTMELEPHSELCVSSKMECAAFRRMLLPLLTPAEQAGPYPPTRRWFGRLTIAGAQWWIFQTLGC